MNFPAICVNVTDVHMHIYTSISEALTPALSKPNVKFQPCDHRYEPRLGLSQGDRLYLRCLADTGHPLTFSL
jgi:hypothetical protein